MNKSATPLLFLMWTLFGAWLAFDIVPRYCLPAWRSLINSLTIH